MAPTNRADMSIKLANSFTRNPSWNTIMNKHCRANTTSKKYLSHRYFWSFTPKKTSIVRRNPVESWMKSEAGIPISEKKLSILNLPSNPLFTRAGWVSSPPEKTTPNDELTHLGNRDASKAPLAG
jgi:hypothetical protein